jgi:hypothetical protein
VSLHVIDLGGDVTGIGSYLGGSVPFGRRKVEAKQSDGSTTQSILEPVLDRLRWIGLGGRRARGFHFERSSRLHGTRGSRSANITIITIGKALATNRREG